MNNDIKKELIVKVISDAIFKIIDLYGINFEDAISENSERILIKIAKIVADTELDDFSAMEEIVCLLEENGIDCGNRHDF